MFRQFYLHLNANFNFERNLHLKLKRHIGHHLYGDIWDAKVGTNGTWRTYDSFK